MVADHDICYQCNNCEYLICEKCLLANLIIIDAKTSFFCPRCPPLVPEPPIFTPTASMISNVVKLLEQLNHQLIPPSLKINLIEMKSALSCGVFAKMHENLAIPNTPRANVNLYNLILPNRLLTADEINGLFDLLLSWPGQDSVRHLSSFFGTKLLGEDGPTSLLKWLHKLGTSVDVLYFPLHLNLHWRLACVHFQNKQISIFDSLNQTTSDDPFFKLIKEVIDLKPADASPFDRYKTNDAFNWNGWTLNLLPDCPQQKNGTDCGVFVLAFLYYRILKLPFDFNQTHVQFFRFFFAWLIAK